jgi:rhomboid protease GluP
MAKAVDSNQRCEASFYTGECHRLQNDNKNAVQNLRDALSSCPKNFMEFDGAAAELKHLGS